MCFVFGFDPDQFENYLEPVSSVACLGIIEKHHSVLAPHELVYSDNNLSFGIFQKVFGIRLCNV